MQRCAVCGVRCSGAAVHLALLSWTPMATEAPACVTSGALLSSSLSHQSGAAGAVLFAIVERVDCGIVA